VSIIPLRSIAGLIQVPLLTKFGVITNVGVAVNAVPPMAEAGTVRVMVSAVDVE
jgi:hypothetical protein